MARGVVARLVGHLLDERALRLVARHSRRLLELLPDLVGQTFDVGLPLLHQALLRAQRVLAPRELRLALGEGLDLPIDALFLLEDSFLQGLQLVTLVARLALPVRFRLDHEVLGMELRFLADGVTLLASLLHDAGGGGVRTRFELGHAAPPDPVDERECAGAEDDAEDQRQDQSRHGDVSFTARARAPRSRRRPCAHPTPPREARGRPAARRRARCVPHANGARVPGRSSRRRGRGERRADRRRGPERERRRPPRPQAKAVLRRAVREELESVARATGIVDGLAGRGRRGHQGARIDLVLDRGVRHHGSRRPEGWQAENARAGRSAELRRHPRRQSGARGPQPASERVLGLCVVFPHRFRARRGTRRAVWLSG